jgi:tetratricopeptide (TPR) repeat protein
MAESKDEPVVVLACKKNASSELYLRSLKSVGLSVTVTESLQAVEELVKTMSAQAMIHALEGFERDETTRFHHNLCRSSLGYSVQRFMIYRSNNMRAVAFSLDVGMQKALPKERASLSLGSVIQMSLQTIKQRNALQEQGLALATSGRFHLSPDEMKLVEKAYKSFPNDLMIRTAQARVYFLRGEYEQAVDLARRVLQSEPYAVRAMTIIGEVDAKMGQFDRAFQFIMKANEFAGGNPDRLSLLARLCIEQGRYPEAKKYLLEGLRLFPQMQILHTELQKVPLLGDEIGEVLELMNGQLSADAISQMAFNLVRPLVLMRKFNLVSEAINMALVKLTETKSKSQFLVKIADELRGMGAKNEAVAQLHRCLEIDPKNPTAGDLLLRMKTNFAV